MRDAEVRVSTKNVYGMCALCVYVYICTMCVSAPVCVLCGYVCMCSVCRVAKVTNLPLSNCIHIAIV